MSRGDSMSLDPASMYACQQEILVEEELLSVARHQRYMGKSPFIPAHEHVCACPVGPYPGVVFPRLLLWREGAEAGSIAGDLRAQRVLVEATTRKE